MSKHSIYKNVYFINKMHTFLKKLLQYFDKIFNDFVNLKYDQI